MKIKRRRHPAFGESSATSDVAFLLIIYFMVIAGFNVNKGFLMTLPAKNSTRLVLKDDILRFNMDGTGSLSRDGNPYTIIEAESLISEAVSGHPNLAVVLTVNPKAPWQKVVDFVELSQKLKIDAFSFTMEKTGAGQ